MSYYSEFEQIDEIVNCDELLNDLEQKRLLKNGNKSRKNQSLIGITLQKDNFEIKTIENQSVFINSELHIAQNDNTEEVPIEGANNDQSESNAFNEICQIKNRDNFNNLIHQEEFWEDNIMESTNEEEYIEENIQSQKLFCNSRMNVKDFNILFMATVDRLAIPESNRNIILDLIRITMPKLNNLPESYQIVQNSFQKPDISSFTLCKICTQEISSLKYDDTRAKKLDYQRNKKKRVCPNDNCSSQNVGLKSRNCIKVYTLNIFSQLKTIIEENETTMLNYMGKITIR